MSTTTQKLITADGLLAMGNIGRCELVYGQLVMMSPAGAEHGVVAGRIFRAVSNFVEVDDLGVVFAAETGFKLEADPDLVRAPDVSFVRKQRSAGAIPKTIQVRHRGRQPTTFRLHETLVDEEILEGFAMPLQKVFQLPD